MEKITLLRQLMEKRGIYACIVGTEDFHNSEYVGEYFRLREYLSGFTGSAGTLLVTLDEALLWTDSRYYIQAASQLSGSGITLMKQEKGVPNISEYLSEKMPDNSVCGFDGRCMATAVARSINRRLSDCGRGLSVKPDVVFSDEVWTDRPPLSAEKVFALPDEVCGKSRAEKLSEIRTVIAKNGADAMFISALDEIAYTLNLRGGDIEYCPLFLSYMMICKERTVLFANPEIFSEEIACSLKNDGVEIRLYGEAERFFSEYDGKVMFDPKAVSCAFGGLEQSEKRLEITSPIPLMKAVKTPSEIKAIKSAHLRDGIAVTRFMKWLKTAVQSEISEEITEISLAEKLEEYRSLDPDYLGQSFAPIMAYGEHAAIVHYSATEQTNARVLPHGMLLSDTGGHYKYGTTDITRTYVLGEISEEERKAFTLVMAGHLNLMGAIFPDGVRGSTLDFTAREPLWHYGMDFGHGTGHGVGFLLNVHEGPQRISRHATNDAPLKEGMITSDEPGFYLEGKFGIRHESLLLCCKAYHEGFLNFEPLTLVPFDSDGIDKRYLSKPQIWLYNQYQHMVYEKLSPYLNEDEAEWLLEVTKPI